MCRQVRPFGPGTVGLPKISSPWAVGSSSPRGREAVSTSKSRAWRPSLRLRAAYTAGWDGVLTRRRTNPPPWSEDCASSDQALTRSVDTALLGPAELLLVIDVVYAVGDR